MLKMAPPDVFIQNTEKTKIWTCLREHVISEEIGCSRIRENSREQ